MRFRPLTLLLVAHFFTSACATAWAQNGQGDATRPSVDELTWMDQNHLAQQRQFVDDLANSELGRPVRGNKSDLRLLQRIVDGGLVGRNETQNLQALGAVLGDVYISEYALEWRAYEDEYGRSRAVCVPDTINCLFPITMLSRRISAGLQPDVEEVYNKGVQLIKPYLPKRPFADP